MKKWQIYAAGVLLGLAFANWVVWKYVLEGSVLRVTFFNVGQGDAIFIQTPQGHQMLIDGGPDQKVVEKISKTLPFWDKSLDMVMLTHPDADHITGLVSVLEQYDVANVLWTAAQKDTQVFRAWEKGLHNEDARVFVAQPGQKIVWAGMASSNEYLEVLYPTAEDVAVAKEVNDTSIVARLLYGNISMLLPGDISKVVEQKLVDGRFNLASDILKVPHHGSKTSSSESFLAAVSPEIGVIQVGVKNRYGHPTQEVLERLVNVGASVLRTDEQGDIIVKINPQSFFIQTN